MKRLIIIILIITSVVTACQNDTPDDNLNNIGVTDIEVEAVQRVLDFYGGICNRSKGFETINGNTEKYFELEISQSKLINNYSNTLMIPASNIAYLFYSNLKNEQNNYTQIRVKINLSNKKSYEHKYSSIKLNEVEGLTQTLQNISNKIRANDYNELLSQFSKDNNSSLTINALDNYCSPYDSLYGQINTTQFQGFNFFKSNLDGRPLANIYGIMIRKNKNTPIKVLLDIKNQKILTMEYKF